MAVNFKQSDALNQVNMTPMIDCIFQLLIFFMLASQFKDYEDYSIDNKLASASEAQPLVASSTDIFVDISRDGKYFVKAKELDLAALDDLFQQAAVNNRLTTKVFIRTDKRAEVDHVVQVTNLAKKAGLESEYAISGGAQSGGGR